MLFLGSLSHFEANPLSLASVYPPPDQELPAASAPPPSPQDHLLLSVKCEAPQLAAVRRPPARKRPHHLAQHLATRSCLQAGKPRGRRVCPMAWREPTLPRVWVSVEGVCFLLAALGHVFMPMGLGRTVIKR